MVREKNRYRREGIIIQKDGGQLDEGRTEGDVRMRTRELEAVREGEERRRMGRWIRKK